MQTLELPCSNPNCKEEELNIDDITDLTIENNEELNSLPEQEPASTEVTEGDWVMLISIDPGFKNLCHTVGYYRIKPDDPKTIQLRWDRKRMVNQEVIPINEMNIPEYNRMLRTWLHKNFGDAEFRKPCVVLIEKQFLAAPYRKGAPVVNSNWAISLKLQLVQTILYTLFSSMCKVPVTFIPSHIYKKQLGISMGQHSENKKAALKFAKESVTPEQERWVDSDHKADCMNQARWHLQQSLGRTFKKQFNVEVTIE